MDTISWEDREGVRWIQLGGELDHDVCLSLKDRLDEAIASGSGDVVLVLDGVTFLGSMGIGMILQQHKKLAGSERTLYLKGIRPSIRSILDSMHLMDVLKEKDA